MSNQPQNSPASAAQWRIPKWFPHLGDELLTRFRAFNSELIFFNGRMNLISPRTEAISDQIHFADCILASQIVLENTKEKHIFDMGAGNGMPGLILAMLKPSLRVTLIDADARKIEFLKHCISRLEIKNCDTMHARLEELNENVIKCAVTRAMASVSKTLLFARKASAHGAQFFHLKSQSWPREVAEIPSQILAYWDVAHIKDYALPDSEIKMTIISTIRNNKST